LLLYGELSLWSGNFFVEATHEKENVFYKKCEILLARCCKMHYNVANKGEKQKTELENVYRLGE